MSDFELVGMMDSPFVRRVAISMRLMGLEYRHRPLSIFATYDEFRRFNPVVKVPSLVCTDGEILVDSSLILDYLESQVAPEQRLLPIEPQPRKLALRIVGMALVAMEKCAQLIYETKQRPVDKQHAEWVERLDQQLNGAFGLLEDGFRDKREFPERPGQAALSTAVAWRFAQHVFPERVNPADYPVLSGWSAQAESLPAFLACPLD